MSKEKIIETAEKLVKAGKIDKAIKEYQKLVSKEPHDMRAKLKIADLLSKKKDLPGALRTYEEVADFYRQENFHLKSIAVYKTILKLNPTLIAVNEKLGDLYRQVGLTSDAINQYYIVAGNYDNRGMVKEAMEIRKKIVAIDPTNTTSRIRLAELMQADGRVEDSIKQYQTVADQLTKQNDKDGLVEVYEKMLYFDPKNVPMLTELCRIYFERGDFKRSLRRLEAAPADVKKNLDVLELWCEALLGDRQIDASRRKFRELYESVIEAKKADRAARVYSRILQEFGDDLDYLNELQEFQKTAGLEVKKVSPKHREDFEKTDMVDLAKFDEYLKSRKKE